MENGKTKNENVMKDAVKVFLFIVGLLALVWMIACDDGSSVLAMGVVAGVAGGKHLLGEPLSMHQMKELSPGLVLNEIDKRIVKIRPMATPVDQLSRWAGAKRSGSMIVDYYSVDTRPTTALTTAEWKGGSGDSGGSRFQTCSLPVDNISIFEVSETLLVKGVKGYKEDGVTVDNRDLVLYVKAKSEDKLSAVTVNGQKIGDAVQCVPTIPSGSTIIRMGRAASELDVQTPQFSSLPVKSQNYCQIFKMQIEQSTFNKITNKEVDWTFSDQEEAAIYDMRLGMEKNFLFGVKSRIYDAGKREDIFLTGGIWAQAGGEFGYSIGKLTQDTVVSMMRKAFTGNAGNKRKVLLGGSGLIEQLNKLDSTKVVMSGENVVKWGIDFTEMRSKFGKLYVLLSEIFDDCGMENNGMIIDPEYLQKYSHVPFTTESLNLKSAGVRNTDAMVLTEASCMTLRYPKAHLRIIGTAS